MGKIYTEQDKLIFYVNTGSSLIEATGVSLEGTNPSGSSITPLITSIESAEDGLVSYQVLPTDFTTAGVWTFWVKVAYAGGYISYGEPFKLNIYSPGT
jgi:hypothetical protein